MRAGYTRAAQSPSGADLECDHSGPAVAKNLRERWLLPIVDLPTKASEMGPRKRMPWGCASSSGGGVDVDRVQFVFGE